MKGKTEVTPSSAPLKDLPLDVREHESWERIKKDFLDGQFDEERIALIGKAHNHAFLAHHGQFRLWTEEKQGKDFFVEHPIETALTLIRLGIDDPNIIAAALLHDTAEDSILWGNPRGRLYSEWIKDVRTDIMRQYNVKVANIVVAETKPTILDGVEIKTREDADKKQIENLINGPIDALLVKMADRYHNFQEVLGMSPEKLMKKIVETEQIFFDIFERARKKYPKETAFLINRIKEEITRHRARLNAEGYTF